MAARLPRSSMFTMRSARFFSPRVRPMPLRLPDAWDADSSGEGEPVGSPDEPTPALRAIFEVVEEMLDHPGEGPRLFAEIAGFLCGERGSVEREAAVLGARAAGSGEQVLQGGHAQLGLDQRAHRVKDEVLAVVEDGFAIATEDALDSDDP